MAFPEKLIVLLPCHSLEDLSTHQSGELAESLLASWVAAWHPSLIAASRQMPCWCGTDSFGGEFQDALVFVPLGCRTGLPLELEQAIESGSAIMLESRVTIEEIYGEPELKNLLDGTIDESFVEDFFALGLAWLQVQLMTRQLRQSSSLDRDEFNRRVVAAAEICCEFKNSDESPLHQRIREALASCFDLLLEERNNYFPTEPKLIELLLIPEHLSTSKLESELTDRRQLNLLLGGEQLNRLAAESSACIKFAKTANADGSLDLIGMLQHPMPIQLISSESAIRQMSGGLKTADQFQFLRPTTFGSFEAGLSPQLPSILNQLDYRLALHQTFTHGQLPRSEGPSINWAGIDGTNINAVAASPVDASQPDSFLRLGIKIGEQLDSWHHANVVFAHWPGQSSRWFMLLRRISNFGPLFGRFRTFSDIADSFHDNGFSETFESDDYQIPHLDLAVERGIRNPISRFAQYWKLHSRLQSAKKLAGMLAISATETSPIHALTEALERLLNGTDEALVAEVDFAGVAEKMDTAIAEQLGIHELQFPVSNEIASASSIVVCPHEFSVPLAASSEIDNLSGYEVKSAGPYSVQPCNALTSIAATGDPAVLQADSKTGLPFLQNEFFAVQVDPHTGGISSVLRHGSRSNLCSQRLAARISDRYLQHGYPRFRSRYVDTQVDKVDSRSVHRHHGSVRTTGRLIDRGPDNNSPEENLIAEFVQTTSVNRGSRQIEFEVELNVVSECDHPPWQNYIASRMAWPDPGATIYRSENEIRLPTTLKKFTAPSFVEIAMPDAKISLLPGGLPFHARSDVRFLDTLLVVASESKRQFQFAIAIDEQTSARAAAAYMASIYTARLDAPAHRFGLNQPGWRLSLSHRNVLITCIQPLFDDSGRCSGLQLRIQETEGRSGDLQIGLPFPIMAARRTNFLGDTIAELEYNRDQVVCKFTAFQLFQVEVCWQA